MRFTTLTLGAVLVAASVAAQNDRVRTGESPPSPVKGEIHAVADPIGPFPFKDLCQHADMIVEGVVETAAARVMPGRNHDIETDFWISVSRVIKGPPDTRKLVTSEMGGTFGELRLVMNYPLMQRGERCVLFLTAEKSPARPQIPGLTRYQGSVFFGRYLVVDGKVRLHSPISDPGEYDGLTVDAFADEIAAQLGK